MSGFQPPPGQYQNYADNSQPYNSQPAGGASTYQQQQSYAGSVGGDSYAGGFNRSLQGEERRGTTTTTRRHDRLLLPSFPLSRLLVSSPPPSADTHPLPYAGRAPPSSNSGDHYQQQYAQPNFAGSTDSHGGPPDSRSSTPTFTDSQHTRPNEPYVSFDSFFTLLHSTRAKGVARNERGETSFEL